MKRSLPAVAVVSVLVSGCGGGGSSSSAPVASASSTTPFPPFANTPTTPTQDLQSTVPTPTYSAGSQELAFFNAYNTFRSQLGLGLLAQSAKLDTAAGNHGKYLAQNADLDLFANDPATGRAVFHIESLTRPGFTSVQEMDPAKFAEYTSAYVCESGSFGSGLGSLNALNNLKAAGYHRSGLMYQSPRNIGLFVGAEKLQTIILLETSWSNTTSRIVVV